jgi:hypothetical protein
MGVFSRGLGGGGSMFAPRISPWPPPQPDLWFVACDLLGLYQSTLPGPSMRTGGLHHQPTVPSCQKAPRGSRIGD